MVAMDAEGAPVSMEDQLDLKHADSNNSIPPPPPPMPPVATVESDDLPEPEDGDSLTKPGVEPPPPGVEALPPGVEPVPPQDYDLGEEGKTTTTTTTVVVEEKEGN